MRAKFINEYLAGERQEGQRFRDVGQVDYPLAEDDDSEEEIEEDISPAAMPSGNFVKKHPDYMKKQL